MLSNRLRQVTSRIKINPFFLSSRTKAAYEGEGKTTVRILNQEQDLGLMIDSYASYGFRLNNGITVLGPIAIFPKFPHEYEGSVKYLIFECLTLVTRENAALSSATQDAMLPEFCGMTILSWQVPSSDLITEESLRFFKLLEPKIDLLIIGTESNERQVMNTVFKSARQAKVNVEILPTEHACATFNFLNAEGRSVAGAMIPPLHVTINEDDMLKSRLHYNNVYVKDEV